MQLRKMIRTDSEGKVETLLGFLDADRREKFVPKCVAKNAFFVLSIFGPKPNDPSQIPPTLTHQAPVPAKNYRSGDRLI